jgi:hypothetical protein
MAFVHSPKIVTDGLVLALDAGNVKSYPGSGTTWLDKSGFGNNGTLINGPTFNSGNGGSIVFDGVDDYVNLGTIGTSIPSYFTWQIIVKPISFPSRLIWTRNNGNSGIWLNLDSSSAQFTIGQILDYFISGTFSLNIVYFLNYVIDNDQWKMYVNGSLLNSINISTQRTQSDNVYVSGVILNNDGTLRSGTFSSQSTYSISYYNRALSASEVLQNYNATKGRFGL